MAKFFYGWVVKTRGMKRKKVVTYWTPYKDEAAACEAFAKIPQSEWAELGEQKQMPIVGAAFWVKEKTAIAEIEEIKTYIKNHRKEIASKEKAIVSCENHIKELKEKIKLSGRAAP